MQSSVNEPTRRFWIGVLAAILMLVGVVLALRAMTNDSAVHAGYERALSLSQAALDAQHANGDLRAVKGAGRYIKRPAFSQPPPR